MTETTQTAVLGGGCFWCLEAVFDQLARRAGGGVRLRRRARPPTRPTTSVCNGDTGHAEVVQDQSSIRATCRSATCSSVFFAIHDPTTKDRQGSDVGTQYRSVIFCQTPEQRATPRR